MAVTDSQPVSVGDLKAVCAEMEGRAPKASVLFDGANKSVTINGLSDYMAVFVMVYGYDGQIFTGTYLPSARSVKQIVLGEQSGTYLNISGNTLSVDVSQNSAIYRVVGIK